MVQTAHGVISGEADSGKLLPHLFIPGETSFEPTRMSRTLKSHQRSAKTFTEGQKIFKEKVRELSLFVLEEETQDGGAAACIGVRGNWRDDEEKPFLVVAENIKGKQTQIMAWEAEINLMFKTVTKS